MRLINTTTLQLHEFHSAPEPYAILSHTWEDEEVSLQDMSLPGVTSKKGYKKIADTCRVAKDEGYRYAWVDTCCIDKSSSADLTEAINSMYRWYKSAAVCYAYLSDVPRRSLARSRWLTRGWTLQELIAPKNVKFFDSEWTYIGSKCDPRPLEEISRITGIDSEVLVGLALPSQFAIATRMSWAASRETTRVEDKAYCLLGIFGVHMPMIYGEGEMAFRRLQEEIIKRENDLTIFAWDYTPGTNTATGHEPPFGDIGNGLVNSTVVPLFSPSPGNFEGGATRFSDDFWEFSLSNKGLVSKIVMRVFIDRATNLKVYGIMLGSRFSQGKIILSRIILRKIGPSIYHRWDKYPRTSYFTDGQGLVQSSMFRSSVPYHILVDPIASTRVPFAQFRTNSIHIPVQRGIKLLTATPSRLWDETDRLFLKPDTFRTYDICLFARMEADTDDGNILFLVMVHFVELGLEGPRVVCKVSPESEVVTDLLKRINAETSLPFEELCAMMPDFSRWRNSVYIGMYQGGKKNTYEVSVSVEKAQMRCECAVVPIVVKDLVVRVEKK